MLLNLFLFRQHKIAIAFRNVYAPIYFYMIPIRDGKSGYVKNNRNVTKWDHNAMYRASYSIKDILVYNDVFRLECSLSFH